MLSCLCFAKVHIGLPYVFCTKWKIYFNDSTLNCQFKFTCWVPSTRVGICICAWRCPYSLLEFFSLTKLGIKCNPQSKYLSFCEALRASAAKILFQVLTVQSDYGTLSVSGGNHCKNNNIITICVFSRGCISEHLAFQKSYRCWYCIIHLGWDCHSCVLSCILSQTVWQQTLIWAVQSTECNFGGYDSDVCILCLFGKLACLKKQNGVLSLLSRNFNIPMTI